jgi:antitoxin CptB
MLDDHRRKLLYRAWRRGFLEMDLIMGQFADAHLKTLSQEEVEQFEALMLAQDQDVYGWLIGRQPPPPEHDTGLLARINAFQLTITPQSEAGTKSGRKLNAEATGGQP